jgi:glycerophosphoryl diester phosphodiesterase
MKTNKMKLAAYWMLFCALAPDGQAADAARTEKLRAEFLRADSPRVLVAAHRGDWRHAPENSLPAIEKCVALGVDIVELDLQRTADGVLVLMHDSKLDRVTTGKGRVADRTLAEIKQLRLRNGLGRAGREQVPTLEEAMLATKDRILVNLDKAYNHWPEVLPVLQRTGTLRQVIMKGSVPVEEARRDLGATLEQVLFMPVLDLGEPGARRLLSGYRDARLPAAYELVFADDKHLDDALGPALRREGARVWVNSLWPSLCGGHDDDLADAGDLAGAYDWLLARGVNVIQTDRPALLLACLRQRGLHD